MHNFFCSCLFFVLIRKDENMMMDLQSNSTVIGKRIDNNFIVMKQGKADNMSMPLLRIPWPPRLAGGPTPRPPPQTLPFASCLLSCSSVVLSGLSNVDYASPATEKFPLMLQSQQSQHAKAGKQGKNSNDLLVDTDILKNFTNMKLRPFSAKNYLTKVSPAVNRPEQ